MKLDTQHDEPELELESIDEDRMYSKTNINAQSSISLVAMSREVTASRVERTTKEQNKQEVQALYANPFRPQNLQAN